MSLSPPSPPYCGRWSKPPFNHNPIIGNNVSLRSISGFLPLCRRPASEHSQAKQITWPKKKKKPIDFIGSYFLVDRDGTRAQARGGERVQSMEVNGTTPTEFNGVALCPKTFLAHGSFFFGQSLRTSYIINNSFPHPSFDETIGLL